jgi:transposase-like protein
MAENEIKIEGSSVGGKITGRDDNSLNFINTLEHSTYIQELYAKVQKEKEINPGLKKFCEDFDYYNSQIANDDIIGLENKLIAGNREKFLAYSKDVKEKFHKKLIKNSQYSTAAQDINVYILAKVRASFMMEVYTLICKNEAEEKINSLIRDRIINPVKIELGLNLFKYDEDDIMGMIFFLTGNCHLKWTI